MNINYGDICWGDITLSRLTLGDIEIVRNWRNDPKISQFMVFKGIISPQDQLRWFESINNHNNYFYIITFKGQKIGLTEIKKIDYVAKKGEWGIFIYEDKFLNSLLPIKVGYLILNFAISELKLNLVTAKVIKDNQRALRFNSFFCFKLVQSHSDHIYLELSSTDFNASVKPRMSPRSNNS